MIEWIESLPLSVPAGWLVAFVLHATVLLLAVWIVERLGGLKHPAWAEWAWRFALFGAFVSVSLELVPWDGMRASSKEAVSTTQTQAVEAAPGVGDAAVQLPEPEVIAALVPSDAQMVSAAQTQDPTTVPLPIANDAMFIGLIMWLSGTLLLFVRVSFQALGLLRLRRRLVQEGVPAGQELQSTMQTLAREMRVRTPVLRVLSGLASPLVLPGAIMLPRWAEGLDGPQQRAMLAHELAHLRRRDPLWRPLQRLALVPLFFHPLAWYALRRLETLAETLCDAAAVERSGNGRHLAECLAECLARSAGSDRYDPHNTDRRGAGWALAMAERSGGIVDRVRILLENSQMKLSTIPKHWRWTAAVLAMLALIALPGVMVVARPGLIGDAFEHHNLSVTLRKDGSTYTVRSNTGKSGEKLRFVSDGDVAFDAQERDVARMGPGARLEIEERRDGVTRKITMVPVANGIRRTYLVDGKARAFDADGQAWLAAIIPRMYRMTGVNAEARAKRLLSEGGVPRLLQEIAILDNDNVRAEYLGQLFAQAKPDDAQTAQALAAVAKIGSDFEKRRALEIALSQSKIGNENQTRLLTMAAEIGSDFERAEWLVKAAPKLPFEGANLAVWSEAMRAFGSDFERKRTLQAVIEEGRPQPQAVALALQSMRGMNSDFEQRSVLEIAADADVALPDTDYFVAIDAIDSDFEKREALVALIRSGAPDLARSRAVLSAVSGISSDFERREVLQALAAVMPNDATLIEDFRDVARRMSDFERAEAEKALDRFYRG